MRKESLKFASLFASTSAPQLSSMFAQVLAKVFVSVIASASKSSIDTLTSAFNNCSLNLPNSLQFQHQAQKAA